MEMKDYERSVNELKKLVESAQEEAEATKKGDLRRFHESLIEIPFR